jgi:hypothetical protein
MYRIDFEPLLDAATPGPVNMPTETEVAARWAAVGAPTALITIDLTAFERASVNAAADLVVEAPSAVNAVAVTFCAALHGTIAHTLDPWEWPTSSWATSVWVLPDEVHVAPGGRLRVRYARRVPGTPDGLGCELVAADSPSAGDARR